MKGSNTVIEVNDKRIRGRQCAWGVAEVENSEHCDFIVLRNTLITFPTFSFFLILNRCLQLNAKKHFAIGQSCSGGLTVTVYRIFHNIRTLKAFH